MSMSDTLREHINTTVLRSFPDAVSVEIFLDRDWIDVQCSGRRPNLTPMVQVLNELSPALLEEGVTTVRMNISEPAQDAAYEHHGLHITLADVIDMVEATQEDAWQTDVVRSEDGNRNCFFGHLFAYAERLAAEAGVRVKRSNPRLTDAEVVANEVWGWFEENYSTTYVVYPVNDGLNSRYPQPTPRQRVLAFLRALEDGRELTTPVCMELEALEFEKTIAASSKIAAESMEAGLAS